MISYKTSQILYMILFHYIYISCKKCDNLLFQKRIIKKNTVSMNLQLDIKILKIIPAINDSSQFCYRINIFEKKSTSEKK